VIPAAFLADPQYVAVMREAVEFVFESATFPQSLAFQSHTTMTPGSVCEKSDYRVIWNRRGKSNHSGWLKVDYRIGTRPVEKVETRWMTVNLSKIAWEERKKWEQEQARHGLVFGRSDEVSDQTPDFDSMTDEQIASLKSATLRQYAKNALEQKRRGRGIR